MYQVYTTKAIIVKSTAIGEANKLYFLLTKDLGFIKATAQGVRLDKSKLKGHLQDYSFVQISLVKGKELWRITNAETIVQQSYIKDLGKMSVIKNIFSLMLRLLHGEEKNEDLFLCVENLYLFFLDQTLSSEELKNCETITVLRILYYLGYFKKIPELSSFTEGYALSRGLIASFTDMRKFAINEFD